MGMFQDVPDYFVELDSYDSREFQDTDTFYDSDEILFGLYVTTDGVEPEIVSKRRFDYTGFLDQDWVVSNAVENSGSHTAECNFCQRAVNDKMSFADFVDFERVRSYDAVVSDKVLSEHLEQGTVYELGSVSASKVTIICEPCFDRFKSIRDIIFGRHHSVVVSHKI